MRIQGHGKSWQADDVESVQDALAWRDKRVGALFWLAPDHENFPTLAIRISGEIADIHYFPQEGHPGFRVVGGDGLPEGEMSTLVFDGCDPASGEETPNEFVVTVETAGVVATEFFQSKQMSETVGWFEL